MSAVDRALALVQTLKFAWWTGHVITVMFTLRAFLASGSCTIPLLGALLSYGCVIYRTYSQVPFSMDVLYKLGRDENAHYLLLALIWLTLTYTEFVSALVPFAVFSTFHTVSYVSGTFLPNVFPDDMTRPEAERTHFAVVWATKADEALRPVYAPAVRSVSIYEITFLPFYLALLVLTFQESILLLVLYNGFVYLRYVTSPITRSAFKLTREWLDSKILNGKMPPAIEQVYTMLKDGLESIAPIVPESTSTERPPSTRSNTS